MAGLFSIWLFSFGLQAQAQFVPTANWRLPNGSLAISDGPTFSYGTLSINGASDKIFTVTSDRGRVFNLAGTTFSSGVYSYKGGSYPGTGGDCTDSMQPLSSCSVVVTSTSSTGGTFNSSLILNYFGGSGTASVARALSTVFFDSTAQLAWASPAPFVKVNECVLFNLERQDSAGNPVSLATPTLGTLIINNATNTSFYSTSACSTVRTVGTIAAGSTGVALYLRSTTGNQSGILVATSGGVTSASHNVHITTTPIRIDLTVAPNIKTNTCTPMIFEASDSTGLPSAVGVNTTINMTTNGANAYYSNAGCSTMVTAATLAAGTSTGTIFTQNATVQSSRTLTAMDGTGTMAAANKNVNFVSSLTWWNAAYQKRMRIDINNLDQAVSFTNQPVLVTLNSLNINYADFKAQGADIRFIDEDDATQLPHETEYWSTIGNSQVWVRVPTIAASSSSNFFYMYYNNPAATDAQSPNPVWVNYWAVWHLGEDPTVTAPQYKDSTSNGRDGTSVNGPLRGPGQIGYAADLNGTTDYIQINQDLAPMAGTSTTVSFWMRTSQTGSNNPWTAPGIMGVEQAGGGNDIFFGWLDTAGNIGVQAGNGAAAKSAYVVNNNAWRHITITRSAASGGTVGFYVNGVVTAIASSESGNKTLSFDRLGSMVNTGTANYRGFLDEVRMVSGVRSAAQIRADFKYMTNTHLNYNSPEDQ